MSGQDNEALVYAYHDPVHLPDWYRKLLDSDRPLPADVFHIERAYVSGLVMVIVTAIPAAFALIMTVIDGLRGKLILKEWLVLFPLFTLPFAWSVLADRRAARLRGEIHAGRLRMGLFLTPDAFLLRMRPDACSLIPRRWISRVDMTVLNAGRAGNGSTYRMQLYYRVNDAGKTSERKLTFDCPELEGYFQGHDALMQLLQKWIADGVQPTAATGKRRPGPMTPDEISKARKAAWRAEEKIRIEQAHEIKVAQPQPRKRPAVFLPDGKLKTQWEHHTADEHHYFCSLSASGEVVAWENWRNYVHSEMGGSISFDQFLAGEYQNLLREQHGMDILEEVVAAVEYLKANPDEMAKHII